MNPLTNELCDWIQENYLNGYESESDEETVIQNESIILSPVTSTPSNMTSNVNNTPRNVTDSGLSPDEKTISSESEERFEKVSTSPVLDCAQSAVYSASPFLQVPIFQERSCSENALTKAIEVEQFLSSVQKDSPVEIAQQKILNFSTENKVQKINKKPAKPSTIKKILKAIEAPEKEISASEKKKLRELARGLTCINCATTKTPLWRRTEDKQHSLCNACGLYFKQYACHRPVAYKARKPRWTKNSAKMAVLERDLAVVYENISVAPVVASSFASPSSSSSGLVSPTTPYSGSNLAFSNYNHSNFTPDYANFASNLGFNSDLRPGQGFQISDLVS